MIRWWLVVSILLSPLASAMAQGFTPLAPDKVFRGPDFGKGKPVVVDTVGGIETTFRALGSPGTKARPSRWRMELKVLVHDPLMDDQDVVTAQLHKGKKKLGEPVVCDREKQLGADSKLDLSSYKLFYFGCQQKPRGVAGWEEEHETSGPHEIRLSLKRTLQGKVEKDFAKLRVHVLELKQGAQNNPSRAWGTDHDAKMPVSMIYEKPLNLILGGRLSKEEERGSNALYGATGQFPTGLVIVTWYKWEKDRGRTTVSCFHDGKKIGLKPIDELGAYEFSHWTHKGKDRAQPRWQQVRYELSRGGVMMRPLAGKTPTYAQPPHWIADNPGNYRCVAVKGGDIVKEFHFTVAEGKLTPPACQAASVNTLHNVVLVPTKTISTGDGLWDKKAGARSAFEGRVTWSEGCPPVTR